MIECPKLNPGILSIVRFQTYFRKIIFQTLKPCLGCLNYSNQVFVQFFHHIYLHKCFLYLWRKFHVDKPWVDKIICGWLFVRFWTMVQVFDHSFYTAYSPCKKVKIELYFCPNQEYAEALISAVRKWSLDKNVWTMDPCSWFQYWLLISIRLFWLSVIAMLFRIWLQNSADVKL